MIAKKMTVFLILSTLAVLAGAQNPPAPGFGPMFGRDMDNLAVGTVLTHEVKVVTGKALFSDRLIPVFAAEGKEFELRLPMMAFSGVNLKHGDTLEIQGIFTTLKSPDGKMTYSVKPQIVKVGGKEINLEQWRDDHMDKNMDRRGMRGGNDQPGNMMGQGNRPGMGPMNN